MSQNSKQRRRSRMARAGDFFLAAAIAFLLAIHYLRGPSHTA